MGHEDRFAVAQSGRLEPVVVDAGHKLLNFVAQTLAVPGIEILLVVVLVLVAQLEKVGLPPGYQNPCPTDTPSP